MEEKIIINKIINSNLAVSSDKAKVVFDKISNNLDNQVISIIDFSELKSLTTAFLNVAIGELYKNNKIDILNMYIKIDTSTLSAFQFDKIKLVMDNSRKKYNQEFDRRINEVTIDGAAD